MKFQNLSESQAYFDISAHVLRGDRLEFVKTFFGLLGVLPFAFAYKVWRTVLKAVAVFASGFFLVLTLGLSRGLRDLFVSKVSALAANVADWVLFPFALISCFSRLLLAFIVHPSLFVRY